MKKINKILSIIMVLLIILPGVVNASGVIESERAIEELELETFKESEVLLEEGESKTTETEETKVEAKIKENLKTEGQTEEAKSKPEIEEAEAQIKEAEFETLALQSTSADNKYIDRINGKNRVETSIEVSKKAYPGKVNTVLLAGHDGKADALTATFVAGQEDAPLLLTYQNKLDSNLLKELKRLSPKKIVILGGENVVNTDVENGLKKQGFNVVRIKGDTRIETAIKVATEYYDYKSGLSDASEVFVIEYDSLIDALAIGPVAARDGIPILITKKDSIPAELVKYLKDKKIKKATIIGGESKISQLGKSELEKIVGAGKVGRIYGSNRVQTSTNICQEYFTKRQGVVVANGIRYTDALIGGYFAAKLNAPIILTDDSNINKEALHCIGEVNVKTYVLGGTSIVNEKTYNIIRDKVDPNYTLPIKPVEPVEEEKPVEPVEEEKPVEPVEEEKPVESVKPVVPVKPVTPGKPMVCLDYGHGGSDPGAVHRDANGKVIRNEKDDTLKTGKLVAADLRRHGVIVDETRSDDRYLSLQQRVAIANAKNYNYFVSFHRNAFIPERAQGSEVWVSSSRTSKSVALANALQSNLVDVGFVNRGVKSKDFYVVRYTKAPAALMEIGFIDNSIDNALYDQKHNAIVKAVSSAILGQLGITYKNR